MAEELERYGFDKKVPGSDLEIISDGEGLVIFGSSTAVELFVGEVNMPSRELDLAWLSPVVAKGGSAVQAASEISAYAGRWMKLTEESARVAQSATLVQRSGASFVQATTRGANGQFAKNLQFVAKLGAMLTNPSDPRWGWRADGTVRHATDDGRNHRLPRKDRCEGRRCA